MAEKFITAEDIKKILQPVVENIKSQMPGIITDAVSTWYGAAGPGSYNRAGGLNILSSVQPSEEWSDTRCTLTWTFDDSIAVNPWEAPWDITYPGNGEQAMDKAFNKGLHGGPRPWGSFGWTWNGVPGSTPIHDLIINGVKGISI